MTDTTSTDSNGKFTFSSVTLQQGQNTLTAKAADSNNKESTDSNELTISYSKKRTRSFN